MDLNKSFEKSKARMVISLILLVPTLLAIVMGAWYALNDKSDLFFWTLQQKAWWMIIITGTGMLSAWAGYFTFRGRAAFIFAIITTIACIACVCGVTWPVLERNIPKLKQYIQ